jgi:lipopolysaccharide/colanic/teichoic acid biosynthesis glycosyltransferase
MLSPVQQYMKRFFDFILSVIGLFMTWWIILLAWIIASIDTKSNGLFMQKRIGKGGNSFFVLKIKTMRSLNGLTSTVTTMNDKRITTSGVFFRRTKIDELPQLINVLFGTMSFVGPRPDVPGFADLLQGKERAILKLLPGITGPASLKYKEEETLLAKQKDPENYNQYVIWPDKVKINLEYMQTWSLQKDIIYILKTVIG